LFRARGDILSLPAAFEQANEVNTVFLLGGISIFAVFFKGGVGRGQAIVSREEGDEDRLSDD